MLVLLIVFMVAAPLLAVSVPVDIATSSATPKADDAAPLTVTVASDGTVLINSTPVPKDQVVGVIEGLSGGNTDQRIYLSGDRNVSYQHVMDIMGLIDAAGFTRIGLLGASGN